MVVFTALSHNTSARNLPQRHRARTSLSDPQSPAEWEVLAWQELAAAETLAVGRHWQQAFYHAGVAVEFALKARIMRVQRLNRWPERTERKELHVHSLSELAKHADLTATLLAEVTAQTDIGICWLAVKDWSINVRYDPRPFPQRRAADMVAAVGKRGLLEWLVKP